MLYLPDDCMLILNESHECPSMTVCLIMPGMASVRIFNHTVIASDAYRIRTQSPRLCEDPLSQPGGFDANIPHVWATPWPWTQEGLWLEGPRVQCSQRPVGALTV